MHRKPPDPLYQCCYSSLLNGRSKNGCFLEDSAKRCFHLKLKVGDQGCLTVLARVQVGCLSFLKNPDYVRAGFFGLMDVHLLARADAMLDFRQLFACRCDLITNAARKAMDVYLLTPANVMLYFRQAFACRCDLIATAARDSASSTATYSPWPKPGCACQKPEVIKAAAGQHWFPVNSHATHVQHMCNKHKCNKTCNESTFTVNLQLKFCFLAIAGRPSLSNGNKEDLQRPGKKRQSYL